MCLTNLSHGLTKSRSHLPFRRNRHRTQASVIFSPASRGSICYRPTNFLLLSSAEIRFTDSVATQTIPRHLWLAAAAQGVLSDQRGCFWHVPLGWRATSPTTSTSILTQRPRLPPQPPKLPANKQAVLLSNPLAAF